MVERPFSQQQSTRRKMQRTTMALQRGSPSWLCLASPLIALLLLLLLLASATASTLEVNPVQAKIEPFLLTLGPMTDQKPLNLNDADYILGKAEDLLDAYLESHFEGNKDTDFAYAILSFADITRDDGEYTTLGFSGGVAYFGGYSAVLPSEPEMEKLVELGINEEDLLTALQEKYPYLTTVQYDLESDIGEDIDVIVLKDAFVDVDTTTSSSNSEPSTILDNSDTTPNNPQEQVPGGLETEEENSQLLIMVVVAAASTLLICLLLGIFLYLRNNERKSFWREESAPKHPGILEKMTAVEEDAACEESLDGGDGKQSSRKQMGKHKSLHLRDSLNEPHLLEQDTSDAGSSRLGRLLSTAAAAVSALGSPSFTEDDNGATDNGDLKLDSAIELEDVKKTGSNDTMSFSDDSDEEDGNGDDHLEVITNGDTVPSEFDGNQVVQPKMVPIENVEQFDDDVNGAPPPPPSQIPANRHIDESAEPRERSTSNARSQKERARPSSRSEGGILSRYWQMNFAETILPIGSLGYFGSGGGITTNQSEDNESTQVGPIPSADHVDRGWSDVSSDRQDDFELDKAWDPDDNSVGSGEPGNGFSPMCLPSRSKNNDDEIGLLNCNSSHPAKYNMERVRCAPVGPAVCGPALKPKREDTAEV